MSTFNEIVALPSVGALYYFDVSIDNGATFTKAYATTASDYASDARIVSLSNIERQFGSDRGLTASAMTVVLANTDGGVDWLCDQATFSSQAKRSIWQLNAVVWDPSTPATYNSKAIAIFALMDPPQRKQATVEVRLVDGPLTSLMQMAATPTIRDWCAITDPDRPSSLTTANLSDWTLPGYTGFDYDAPIPVILGGDEIAVPRVLQNCYVLCAVPGDGAGLPTETFVTHKQGDLPIVIRDYTSAHLDTQIVTVYRTPVITKNGKDWHLLWADVDLNGDATATRGPGSGDATKIRGYLQHYYDTADDALFTSYSIHNLIGPLIFDAKLWSYPSDTLGRANQLPAMFAAYSLLTNFLPTGVTIDTFDSDLRRTSFVSGIIAAGTKQSTTALGLGLSPSYASTVMASVAGRTFMDLIDGDFVRALRQICVAGRFDIFFKGTGHASLVAMAPDFSSQTATVSVLPEEAMAEVVEAIPAVGERNQPTNRTFVRYAGNRFGPFDDVDAVAEWGTIVSKEIDGEWMANAGDGSPGLGALYDQARGQAIARPVLTVVTGLNGLAYELADYLSVTWVRGTLGGPYVGAIFRVEGISLSPMDGKVQLKLLWCDDLRSPSNLPYILDDETLYTRVAASGGRTCTLTDSSTTVSFSSGSLVADGVTAGDSLIVKDSTESATTFKRNRVLRVVSRTDATHLVVDLSDFGSGGPFTIADWEVRKSALTSARATYFGKTCDSSGEFSDDSYANRLLEG